MPPSEGSHPGASLRKWWWLASAGVLLAIPLLSIGLNISGMRDRLLSLRTPPRIASLAVLPLENLSGDSAQEYFADGMTDELITEVAKISSLRVISRTSIMQYKGAHKPLAAIASELGVEAVVEGRHEEAIAEATRARELDPISVGRTAFLAAILYRARKYDEAIGACQKALELDSNHPNTFWFLALSYEQKREFPEAIAQLEKAVRLTRGSPMYRGLLANAYALAGERAKALSTLGELKALSQQRYVSPLDIAVVYTGLGDRNSAFQWLEKAYQERTMRIQELPQPIFDSLRSDPRFRDLMRGIGLPP